jgi:hypothetical protein
MRKLISLATVITALALAACGDNTLTPGAGGPTVPGSGPPVAGVTVLASSPSLPSNPGQTLTIQAIVRDSNNVAMDGVTVIMSSDSGTLTVTNPVTDQSGIVSAVLNAGGDPTPRSITITADAQGVTDSVSVDVTGTDISISGPGSLAQGDTATYTVVLLDAAGNGIGGRTVDVTSANGNTLSASTLTTDGSGQAQVSVTASAAGQDTLTSTALGIMATTDVNVSNDSFSLTAPAAGDQIVLNTPTAVSLTWTVGGTPQAGQTITFGSTRGTLSAPTAITDATGTASVTISSTNAGPAQITASNASGTTTSVVVQFIANTPASIDLQANPFTIGPNEQSQITAVVRDAAGNLVTNSTVQFDLQDVTGGQLSVASASTDLQGRATTFYTSSATTSANNGVVITGTVSGTAIANSVALTVAQRELFISIGTGNTIFEPNSAQYRVEFAVQITDSQGNGVEGVTVQAGILSNAYYKGFWFYDVVASGWFQNVTAGPCADEDTNRNGVLDYFPNVPVDEDANLSGRIEAGNIATAASQSTGNGTFTTDAAGFGIVDVFYPQDHARWVGVTLEATTSVQGTEFAEASTFILPISGDDVSDEDQAPPGVISPFGQSNSCLDTQ